MGQEWMLTHGTLGTRPYPPNSHRAVMIIIPPIPSAGNTLAFHVIRNALAIFQAGPSPLAVV
jgi:hypothetical protein